MKTYWKAACTLAILFILATSAYAQEPKVTFGVKGGMNISNFWDDLDDADAKVGVNVGVTLDVGFTERLFLLTGLEYNTKGAKTSGLLLNSTNAGYAKVTLNPMYIQLPLHFGYKLPIGQTTKIVFRGGTYFAYGVGGKAKLSLSSYGNEKVDVFQDGLLKKFDFGLGTGVGVELGKIALGMTYDLGLLDIWDVSGFSVRNNSLDVHVGYKF